MKAPSSRLVPIEACITCSYNVTNKAQLNKKKLLDSFFCCLLSCVSFCRNVHFVMILGTSHILSGQRTVSKAFNRILWFTLSKVG